jgi:hypothetical protein
MIYNIKIQMDDKGEIKNVYLTEKTDNRFVKPKENYPVYFDKLNEDENIIINESFVESKTFGDRVLTTPIEFIVKDKRKNQIVSFTGGDSLVENSV